MILVYLQKISDILDRKILLENKKYINFNRLHIRWFELHFPNMKYFSSLNEEFSEEGAITCKTPKGFIIRRILFFECKWCPAIVE